uniref:Uncharacterized protein n=1 Tax=Cannabis sativa TaxID=3483 RepID=A0A803PDS6_CANSA
MGPPPDVEQLPVRETIYESNDSRPHNLTTGKDLQSTLGEGPEGSTMKLGFMERACGYLWQSVGSIRQCQIEPNDLVDIKKQEDESLNEYIQ